MTEPEPTPSARALDRLTFAVWALVVVSAVNGVVTLVSLFLPIYYYNRGSTLASGVTETFESSETTDRYSDFHQWPVEKQIQEASVIALTKHRIDDGKRTNEIAEILKQAPGTTFHYKVGDPYGRLQYTRDDVHYGDGQVLFFVGPSAPSAPSSVSEPAAP